MSDKQRIRKRRVVEQSTWDLAVERVAHTFDIHDHVVVSFSGGKDSSSVFQLAYAEAIRRNRLPLHVIFFDEEAIPYETEHYVRRIANLPGVQLDWLCVPIISRNACSRRSPWWSPFDPDVPQEKWVRPMPPEGIWRVPGVYEHPPMAERLIIPDVSAGLFPPAQYGQTAVIMGIRGQESIMRTRAVSRRLVDNYIIPDTGKLAHGNVWKVYPIYDWTTEDVWTAHKLYDWDHNAAYDAMDKAGILPFAQRCCPPYGEEPVRGLWMYRECFPNIWDKMCTRVPGANTAMRYARTELFSYRDRPQKPADMTWEQFILHYIAKFRPEDAQMIANRLRNEIEWHYSRTTEPILPETPHPVTGLCWRFLLMVAIRGDFKERKDSISGIWGKDRERMRQLYDAERASLGL